MPSKPLATYAWYPDPHGGETQHQREHRIARDWLSQNLPDRAKNLWQAALQPWQTGTVTEAMNRICKFDSAELVDLLYPRFPQLFRPARKYALSPELFANLWTPGPYSEELLTQCYQARTAYLGATCLFALTGAVGCLETLLEYGADPNGLELPDSWSYIELPNRRILPVTPLDCATLSDNEDCQLILELYGGKALHEQLSPL